MRIDTDGSMHIGRAVTAGVLVAGGFTAAGTKEAFLMLGAITIPLV